MRTKSSTEKCNTWNFLVVFLERALKSKHTVNLKSDTFQEVQMLCLYFLQLHFRLFADSYYFRAYSIAKYRRRSSFVGAKDVLDIYRLDQDLRKNYTVQHMEMWQKNMSNGHCPRIVNLSQSKENMQHKGARRMSDLTSVRHRINSIVHEPLCTTISDLLSTPTALKYFKIFLSRILCDEILLFYLEVEEYQRLPNNSVRYSHLNLFVKRFLGGNATVRQSWLIPLIPNDLARAFQHPPTQLGCDLFDELEIELEKYAERKYVPNFVTIWQ